MLVYFNKTVFFVGLLFTGLSRPVEAAGPGGAGAAQGDTVPFMLVVEHAAGSRCAASLVSLHSAMTSASCARLGSGSIFVLTGPYLTGQVSRAEGSRRVSSIALPRGHIRADDYSGAVDDVAVLRLASPFVTSALVRPILMETEHTTYEALGTLCNLVRARPGPRLRRRRRRDETISDQFDNVADLPHFPRDIAFTSSDEWLFPFAAGVDNVLSPFEAIEGILNSAPNVASDSISKSSSVAAATSILQLAQYNSTLANFVTAADVIDKTGMSSLDMNYSTLHKADSGSIATVFHDNFTQVQLQTSALVKTETSSFGNNPSLYVLGSGSTIKPARDNLTLAHLVTSSIDTTGTVSMDVNTNVVDVIIEKDSAIEDILNSVSTIYPDSDNNNNVTLYNNNEEYFIGTSVFDNSDDTRAAQQNANIIPTLKDSLLQLVNSTSGTIQSEETTDFETIGATSNEDGNKAKKRSLGSSRSVHSTTIFRIYDVHVTSAEQCKADNSFAGNHYWVSMREQVLCTRGPPFCQGDWGSGLVCAGKLCAVLSRSAYPEDDGASGSRRVAGCGTSHTLQSLARWRRFLHCAHSVGACGQDPCVKVCREVMLTGDMDKAPSKKSSTSARTKVSTQKPLTSSMMPVAKTMPVPHRNLPDSDDEDEEASIDIDVPEGYMGKDKTAGNSVDTGDDTKGFNVLVSSKRKPTIDNIEGELPKERSKSINNPIKAQTPLVPTRSSHTPATEKVYADFSPLTKLTNNRVENADFDPHRPDFITGEYGDNAADYRNPDEDYQVKGGGARRPPTRTLRTSTTKHDRAEPTAMQHVIVEPDTDTDNTTMASEFKAIPQVYYDMKRNGATTFRTDIFQDIAHFLVVIFIEM